MTLDAALDADVIILAIPFLQVRELGRAVELVWQDLLRRLDQRVPSA